MFIGNWQIGPDDNFGKSSYMKLLAIIGILVVVFFVFVIYYVLHHQ